MRSVLPFLLSLFFFGTICAQPAVTQPHPGIVLYQQAKYAEAITALEAAAKTKEYKSDPEIWNYLGLAYHAKGNSKKSQQALEKSVKLNGSSAVYHANFAYVLFLNQQTTKARSEAEKAVALNPRNPTALLVLGTADLQDRRLDAAQRRADLLIEIDAGNAGGYLLISQILLAKFEVNVAENKRDAMDLGSLEQAVKAIKNGIARATGDTVDLEEQLETLSALQEHFSRRPTDAAGTAPTEPGADVTPVRIISKRPAPYTDMARKANIQGNIVVKVLLGANGKVVHVFFVRRLGHGLDESVLSAAKSIKFEPKRRNGKPVSTLVTLEYNFNIY